MYRGFNLKDISFEEDINVLAKQYDMTHKNLFSQKLFYSIESFIQTEYTFNGSALINLWFPKTQRPDIFISHSHSDIKLAKALAQWLEDEFSLSSFIDSTVWGDFTILRKKINNYFFTKLGSKYDCNQQDRVSQHVMMMLNTSLMEMMDRCQSLFFLNTPNSISVEDVCNDSTYSPWIFSEIGMFNCIKKTIPLRESVYKQYSRISYKLDLSQLTELTCEDLNEWYDETRNLENNTRSSCLNKLYKLHPLIQKRTVY